MRARYLAALLTTALAAAVAVAADFGPPPPPPPPPPPAPLRGLLPLAVGNFWQYVTPAGLQDVETITGTLVVRGRTVYVKHYSVGDNAGLDNWWITGPAGEVQLAGFDNPNAGFSIAYEPPITVCGGNPAVGDSWTTDVVAWGEPGDTVFAAFTIVWDVLETPALTLPAGTFHTVGVAQGAPPAALSASGAAPARFTLDGRRIPSGLATSTAATRTPSDWFAEGVGVVQWGYGDDYQLVAWSAATPVRPVTWGGLKARYR